MFIYLDKNISISGVLEAEKLIHTQELIGHFVKWPPRDSVKCLLFCWINVFKKTLFIISTTENVYLDKNISILCGLDADIDTRRMWTLSAIFKMATTEVSKIFLVA